MRVRTTVRAVVAGTTVVALTLAALSGLGGWGRPQGDRAAGPPPEVVAGRPDPATTVGIGPPRCGGDAGRDATPPARTLIAPLTDPACTAAVWWDAEAGVLSVPDGSGGRRRFALGAPGDEVLLGDWDCDGRATPAVYRPDTGEVHLFAAWPTDPVPAPAVRADVTGVLDGTASVASSAPGTSCQEVRVEP